MPTFNNKLLLCIGGVAAAIFIGCSAAQSIVHSYSLGMRSSELAAMILASGALAGALMQPVAFAASWEAFRNGLTGRGLAALALGLACFAYAGLSALSFSAGARDTATASRTAAAAPGASVQAILVAAATELQTLAAAAPADRKTEAKRSERRKELEATLREAGKTAAAVPAIGAADPAASALAAYATAAGFPIEERKLAPWLALAMALFVEAGAGLSLIVLGAIGPWTMAERPAAETPAISKALAGRKRTAPLERIVKGIEAAGGQLEGSLASIGKRLGTSRSSAHRGLNELAALGLVTLASSPLGTVVAIKS